MWCLSIFVFGLLGLTLLSWKPRAILWLVCTSTHYDLDAVGYGLPTAVADTLSIMASALAAVVAAALFVKEGAEHSRSFGRFVLLAALPLSFEAIRLLKMCPSSVATSWKYLKTSTASSHRRADLFQASGHQCFHPTVWFTSLIILIVALGSSFSKRLGCLSGSLSIARMDCRLVETMWAISAALRLMDTDRPAWSIWNNSGSALIFYRIVCIAHGFDGRFGLKSAALAVVLKTQCLPLLKIIIGECWTSKELLAAWAAQAIWWSRWNYSWREEEQNILKVFVSRSEKSLGITTQASDTKQITADSRQTRTREQKLWRIHDDIKASKKRNAQSAEQVFRTVPECNGCLGQSLAVKDFLEDDDGEVGHEFATLTYRNSKLTCKKRKAEKTIDSRALQFLADILQSEN